MSNRKELLQELKLGEVIQHTEPDVRFYELDGEYYPSVTTILEMLPKDEFLEMWKDKNGSEAVNQLLYKASVAGTKVHNAIDELCVNFIECGIGQIDWFDELGHKKYTAEEWSGILKFCDFFENYVDDVELTEAKLVSKKLFVSGTLDSVFILNDGRRALIDHKFANNLNDKYSVQSWAYKEMYEELSNNKIDVRGNLWLKAQTKGYSKKGDVIQGNGWKFVEHSEEDRDKLMFESAHKIFMDKWRNKEIKPSHKIYNVTAQIIKK